MRDSSRRSRGAVGHRRQSASRALSIGDAHHDPN
jgi:hypothetical protein